MSKNSDDKKTALIITLNHVLVAHGFAKLSMNKLATLAGVSRATLYLYFDNKDAIVDAAIARHLNFIAQNTQTTVAPTAQQYVRTRINTLLLLGSLSPQLRADLQVARPDLAVKLADGYTAFHAGIIAQLNADHAAGILDASAKPAQLYLQDQLFIGSISHTLSERSLTHQNVQAVLTSYLTGTIRGTLTDPDVAAAAINANQKFIATIWGELQATYH